jgi:hypothetical protein
MLYAAAGLALLVAGPVAAQTGIGSDGQPPAGLQNQIVVKSDGTIYLVRDGTKHQVTPATAGDDAIGAIPDGDPYTSGLVPADTATASTGDTSPPSSGPQSALAPSLFTTGSASGSSGTSSTGSSTSTGPAALPSSVHVDLNEWSITPDATTLAAGKVSFDVADAGKLGHEMVIFKSDKDPGSLTVTRSRVDEGSVGTKIGEVEDLKAGDDKSATFDLKPGT